MENNRLSQTERIILREVLVNQKNFSELTETLKLTSFRQKQIFTAGASRLQKALKNLNESLNAYYRVSEDLNKAKQVLEVIEKQKKPEINLSPEQKKVLSTPLFETGLSVRLLTICEHAGINTVSDLVKLSKLEFLRLRNCGRKTLKEAEEFVDRNHLSWRMQV